VDTSTGLSTLLGTLDNGSDDGQALAHNPVDGLLYHAAGLGNRNNHNGEIFEKLDPDTCTGSPDFDCDPTSVDLSGDDYVEITALTYLDGGFFAGDLGDETVDMPHFFRITTTGVVTDLGAMNHVSKGLVRAPPQLPTLSTALLGVLAGLLSAFGCWSLARPDLSL
jgi:hypothetical protein